MDRTVVDAGAMFDDWLHAPPTPGPTRSTSWPPPPSKAPFMAGSLGTGITTYCRECGMRSGHWAGCSHGVRRGVLA